MRVGVRVTVPVKVRVQVRVKVRVRVSARAYHGRDVGDAVPRVDLRQVCSSVSQSDELLAAARAVKHPRQAHSHATSERSHGSCGEAASSLACKEAS